MHPLTTRISRRGFLSAAAALGASTALVACGFQEETPAADGGATWTFTDDRGQKLDGQRPTRIVAYVGAAAALWDFGVRPIGIFGPSKLPDGKPDVQAGSVDLNTVTSLGNVYDEFNYDKFVELNPQLLVSVMYTKDDLWYVPANQSDRIAKAAPSVGIRVEKLAMPKVLARFEELAKALGADVEAPAVKQAKAAYEKADADLATAAKRAAGLKVLILSPAKDAVYANYAPGLPSTAHFAERGVNFVVPKPDASGYYEELSWENVGKYPADVIMYDTRFQSLTLPELAKVPTWRQLPAVKAGRLVGWNSEAPFSYQAFTTQLTDLTTALNKFATA